MKNSLKVLATAIGISLNAPAFAQHIDIPVLVPSPVQKVFAPAGFDDNDNSEVIVHGYYPSTCYTNGNATYKIDEAQKKIIVTSRSYYHIGSPCAQMMTPYVQSVKLGMLKAGDYKIEVKGSPSAKAPLFSVQAAPTESQDDYLYANVENVWLQESGEHQVLTMSGTHPKLEQGCVVMKDVKLKRTHDDVLVVLPITEIVDGMVCQSEDAQRKFTFETQLDQTLEVDSLIHVRTSHGNSINHLIR